jgi:DUF971 family protein
MLPGRGVEAVEGCAVESAFKLPYSYAMRPLDIQAIGQELAIKWEDGSESFIPLEKLRRHCPCAGCKGEMDVMGKVYKNPDRPLTPQAFQLRRVATVGGYAIQPFWGDGHQSGLFAFDYLCRVADAEE